MARPETLVCDIDPTAIIPDTATEPDRTIFKLASDVVAPTVAKERAPDPASRLKLVVAGTAPLRELLNAMLAPTGPL